MQSWFPKVRAGRLACAILAAAFPCAHWSFAGAAGERDRIEAAMKLASRFMVERVGPEGGYVWSYLPDFSRRWGELEAGASMIWIQPPGTASMGDAFLNAYQATSDEYYYEAAAAVGRALERSQHPAGGWNYCADFAGEASLREWYATVGRTAWRFEEFHHYYGNATFDDGVTVSAAGFLLRLEQVRRDGAFRPALERAIQFILDAQYPHGGWPQRFPLVSGFSREGGEDYPGYATFNDDVAAGNIRFLLECAGVLGDERARAAAVRGMEAYLRTQQERPQAGWALQYTPDELAPAGARTYEPRALVTHATAQNIEQLYLFFKVTGEDRFLARVPEALDWLDSVALPAALRDGTKRTHPTFVELGTNRPLYLHRTGSNAANGRYFVSSDPDRTIAHYSSFRVIDVAGLRREYAELKSQPPEPSPSGPDRTGGAWRRRRPARSAEQAERVLAEMRADGAWLVPLRWTSRPYRGEPPVEVTPGDFSQTNVGDDWDTSTFQDPQPVLGLSTGTYIENMETLIARLRSLSPRKEP